MHADGADQNSHVSEANLTHNPLHERDTKPRYSKGNLSPYRAAGVTPEASAHRSSCRMATATVLRVKLYAHNDGVQGNQISALGWRGTTSAGNKSQLQYPE